MSAYVEYGGDASPPESSASSSASPVASYVAYEGVEGASPASASFSSTSTPPSASASPLPPRPPGRPALGLSAASAHFAGALETPKGDVYSVDSSDGALGVKFDEEDAHAALFNSPAYVNLSLAAYEAYSAPQPGAAYQLAPQIMLTESATGSMLPASREAGLVSYTLETSSDPDTSAQRVVDVAPPQGPSSSSATKAVESDPRYRWTNEFRIVSAKEESHEKYVALSRLAREFVDTAESYARVIVGEIGLPIEAKTVKPIDVGGIAGGTKFIVQGILFKFAQDDHSIYGGDENAQKAASHDLKGLMAYAMAEVPGLHFPLMTVIRYLGFCLIAVSLLPLTKDSLIYGCSDGGLTMHHNVDEMNEKMKRAGEALNLQPHISGIVANNGFRFYAPGDIEGHRGSDGRFYVLDFARTFPSEARLSGDPEEKGAFLFKLLRRELLKTNDVPLNPDSFTMWNSNEPDRTKHATNVRAATVRLRTKLVPELAGAIKDEEDVNIGDIISRMHSLGINVRHLGLVRAALGSSDCLASRVILREMIARSVKSIIQERWRSAVHARKYANVEVGRDEVAAVLNLMVEKTPAADAFWSSVRLRILVKYRGGLFPGELASDFSLRSALTTKTAPAVLFRIFDFCGLEPSDSLRQSLDVTEDAAEIDTYVFLSSDIRRIASVTKNMHIIEFAEALATLYAGLGHTGGASSRLFRLALRKLQDSKHTHAFREDLLLNCANVLVKHFRSTNDPSAVDLAEECFRLAYKFLPKSHKPFLRIALLNVGLGRKGDVVATNLEKALAIKPSCKRAQLEMLIRSSSTSPHFFSIGSRYRELDAFVEANPDYPRGKLYLARSCLDELCRLRAGSEPSIRIREKFIASIEFVSLHKPKLFEEIGLDHYLREYFDTLSEIVSAYLLASEMSGSFAEVVQKALTKARWITLKDCNSLPDGVLSRVLAPALFHQDHLRLLDLSGCTQLSLESLGGLLAKPGKSLTELLLDRTKLSDTVFDLLARCNLKRLSLNGAIGLTESGLLAHLESRSSYDWLQLDEQPLTDTGLEHIVSRFPSLRKLTVANCSLLSIKTIELIASKANNLAWLDLSGIQGLTLDLLKNLITPMTALRSVSVKGTALTEAQLFGYTWSLAHPTLGLIRGPTGFPHYLQTGDSHYHQFNCTGGNRMPVTIPQRFAVDGENQVYDARFSSFIAGNPSPVQLHLHPDAYANSIQFATIMVTLSAQQRNIRAIGVGPFAGLELFHLSLSTHVQHNVDYFYRIPFLGIQESLNVNSAHAMGKTYRWAGGAKLVSANSGNATLDFPNAGALTKHILLAVICLTIVK